MLFDDPYPMINVSLAVGSFMFVYAVDVLAVFLNSIAFPLT